VLLLEAGPDYPHFEHLPDDLKLGNNVWLSAYGPHNWGYVATVTPQQTRLTIPRGKATGGSSAINGQVLYRGIPEDYDNWAAWGNEEWSFSKVLPYFCKMETDMDFGGDFHGANGPVPVRRYTREEWLPHSLAFHQACVAADFRDDPDQNHPESTGVSPRARNTLDGVRISMALAYLDPARHRLNLTVKGHVMACRLRILSKRAGRLSPAALQESRWSTPAGPQASATRQAAIFADVWRKMGYNLNHGDPGQYPIAQQRA
jgi:choline dehydrogenase